MRMVLEKDPQVIRLPPAALRYVLHQRPMLQAYNGWLRRLGVPLPVRVWGNIMLRGRQVAAGYSRMIRDDYEMIRPHLPERAERILDIGCGIAGLDVLLHAHYRGAGAAPELCLLDRTDVSVPRYGFADRDEFYNALELSRRVLVGSGVPASAIRILDVGRGDGVPEGPLDLVVSIASWGFHYQISTYLDEVHRELRPGGRLILDVRLGVGQREQLEQRFHDVATIGTVWDGKAERVCVVKDDAAQA